MIEELEEKQKFTLSKLERLWKIYDTAIEAERRKPRQNTCFGYIKSGGADNLTLNQFKLVMFDAFKVHNCLKHYLYIIG